MLDRVRQRGFSLIELMVAIAVMSALLLLGVPAFSTYLQNAKLRSAAENFYGGIQLVRAEAVRRNAQVQMILTDDDPVDANGSTTNLSTTGANWMIRTPDPAIPGAFLFIEGKAMTEGSGQRTGDTATVQVNGGGVTAITYNGFGGTTLGAAATFAFTNPVGGDCVAASGPMRCLNVTVSIGGQARLCDPAVTAAGDTRAC